MERAMSDHGKRIFAAIMMGAIIGLTICVLFGVMDVQCYGTGRPNWNAQAQACE
jgi:hypothetical protein